MMMIKGLELGGHNLSYNYLHSFQHTHLSELAICEELEQGALAHDTVPNQDQTKLVVENGIDHGSLIS